MEADVSVTAIMTPGNQGQRPETTVRTAQVSREDQEETVRTEADVSVTAIMTPEIRVRDAEMMVRTAQVSREDQEETARDGGGRFRDGNNDSRNQGQGRRNDGQRPSGGRNREEAVWAAKFRSDGKTDHQRIQKSAMTAEETTVRMKVDKFEEQKSNRLGQGGNK